MRCRTRIGYGWSLNMIINSFPFPKWEFVKWRIILHKNANVFSPALFRWLFGKKATKKNKIEIRKHEGGKAKNRSAIRASKGEDLYSKCKSWLSRQVPFKIEMDLVTKPWMRWQMKMTLTVVTITSITRKMHFARYPGIKNINRVYHPY